MLGRQKAHTAASSQRSRESAWRVHVSPRWAKAHISDVKATDVQAWVAQLSTDPPTGRRKGVGFKAEVIETCLTVLSGIMDDAVTDRRIPVNPLRGKLNCRAGWMNLTSTAPIVRAKMKALRNRVDVGAPIKDATSTVADWLIRWRTTTLAVSDRKESTRSRYASLARKHLEPAPFGAIALDRLRPSDIEALLLALRGRGLSESTVRQVCRVSSGAGRGGARRAAGGQPGRAHGPSWRHTARSGASTGG